MVGLKAEMMAETTVALMAVTMADLMVAKTVAITAGG